MTQHAPGRSHQRAGGAGLVAVLVLASSINTTVAQDYSGQQYRFAPRNDVPDSSWQTMPQEGLFGDYATQETLPYASPGGRIYRFREGPENPSVAEQPRFRPDRRLGQTPRNWGMDSEWAEDPVLRQGMVFRPLDKDKRGTSENTKPPPAVAPYPYYGYPPAGAVQPEYYPAPGFVPWGM